MISIGPIPRYDKYITLICHDEKPVVYLLSDFLLAFMCTRLFFVMRTLLNYTIFTDAYARKLNKSYGFKTTLSFTLKCHLKERPMSTVFSLYAFTILSAAYFIRIFEKPYFRKIGEPLFDSFFDSIWFTVITQTTIGYGDISPGTTPGKISVIILAFWSALLTSLLVVTVSSIFEMGND